MRLAATYDLKTLPGPALGVCQAWERQLSLLDWARLCRVRDLLRYAPWQLADPEGLVLTYAWSLHAWRHCLARPDPLEWLTAVLALERTHDICLISHQTEDGWECGDYVVTLRSAIHLLARFGQGRHWWDDKWSCEECLCRLCGAAVAYPFTTCLEPGDCVERIRRYRGQHPA